jgi:hypothetical protein
MKQKFTAPFTALFLLSLSLLFVFTAHANEGIGRFNALFASILVEWTSTLPVAM